jgi:hypothetical protein
MTMQPKALRRTIIIIFVPLSHISVECCFGEVDLRFGIFWKPLKFSLGVNCQIIDACRWLYNFILDNSTINFMDSIDKEVVNEDYK